MPLIFTFALDINLIREHLIQSPMLFTLHFSMELTEYSVRKTLEHFRVREVHSCISVENKRPRAREKESEYHKTQRRMKRIINKTEDKYSYLFYFI